MILDFILIASFFGSIATGYIKGFSRTFATLFAFVISIVLATSLNSWVGDIALSSSLGKSMQKSISDSINTNFEDQKNSFIENSPYLSSLFKLTSNEKDIIDFSPISDSIAKKSISSLISVIIIILTTIGFKFIFKFIKKIFLGVSSIPVIGTIDSFFGGICGIVFGVIVVALVFVLAMFIQFIPELEFVCKQYNDSIIILLINDFIF